MEVAPCYSLLTLLTLFTLLTLIILLKLLNTDAETVACMPIYILFGRVRTWTGLMGS